MTKSKLLVSVALSVASALMASQAQAQSAGVKRVYWQTQVDNTAGRLLYDKVARHHGFIVYSRDM